MVVWGGGGGGGGDITLPKLHGSIVNLQSSTFQHILTVALLTVALECCVVQELPFPRGVAQLLYGQHDANSLTKWPGVCTRTYIVYVRVLVRFSGDAAANQS